MFLMIGVTLIPRRRNYNNASRQGPSPKTDGDDRARDRRSLRPTVLRAAKIWRNGPRYIIRRPT